MMIAASRVEEGTCGAQPLVADLYRSFISSFLYDYAYQVLSYHQSSNKPPWDLIVGKHSCKIISYFKKTTHENSYTALLPLIGDKKAERNVTFVMIMKKSLLANTFCL